MPIATLLTPARVLRVVPALLSLGAALIGGCVTDEHAAYDYGASVKEIMASQVNDPQAGGDKPVQGLSAAKAGKAQRAYIDGEKKDQQQGVLEKIASEIGGQKPAASN